MRAMANEKKISLIELNKLAEKDKSIDIELDGKLKELGKTRDNFVVDGRLTAFFIPNAKIRIFLEADENVRANRILNDKRANEKNLDLAETMENIKKREESEKIRYEEYYGVDYCDRELYNYILNTTSLSPNEVIESILQFIENFESNI